MNQEKDIDCKIKNLFPYSKEFSCLPSNATIQNKLDCLYNRAKDYLENEERIKRIKDIKLSQLDCELILAISNSTIYQLETFYWETFIPTELRNSLINKEQSRCKLVTIGIKNSKKEIRFKVKDIYFKDLKCLRTYYFEDLVWLARKILSDEGVK